MTYLSTLAQATSNAIKAAQTEFSKNITVNNTDSSTITPTTYSSFNPKCPIPMRMKILNDPNLLKTHRETYLNIK